MAYNQSNNFWEFVRAYGDNNHGVGVDRPDHPPPEFPSASAPDGGFGGPSQPHEPDSQPHRSPHPPPGAFPFAFGRPGHFGGGRGFHGGGRRGRCGRRGSRDGDGPLPYHGPCHHRGPRPHEAPGAFDLNALLSSLSGHPLAQAFRAYAEQFAPQQSGEAAPEEGDGENSFTPPIDIFSNESHFILHVALPGAKKEDVGVHWDAEKGVLNIAGVIYRQGDEEFLRSLTQSERKVGVFERFVKLPPGTSDEKEEVDGDNITAKLEDGVLVVNVPKVEKEWTDVKKVDIQ